jgi:hypothetical protein
MAAKATASAITTRQKVTVGILAAVLIGVLIFPATETSQPAADGDEAAGPPRPSAQSRNTPVAQQPIDWPKTDLDAVLSQNPFRELEMTAASPEPIVAAAPVAAEDLEQVSEPADVTLLRVSAILRGPKGPAAIIDGRIVHEGDLVDGCRIVRIQSAGVFAIPE